MYTEEWASKIVAKAQQDSEFKAALLEDPRAAIEEMFTEELPESLSIEAVEEANGQLKLIVSDADELSDEDLDNVAGGTSQGQRRSRRGDRGTHHGTQS